MKKIIAMVAALATVSSFAGMISFDVKDYVGNSDTVFSPKFSYDTSEPGTGDETSSMDFGLNYAHQLGSGAQVQLLFARASKDDGTNDGSEMTLGVGYIHNFDSDLANSWYVAGRYMMQTSDNDDGVSGILAKDGEITTIQVEYGRRMVAYKTGNYTWAYSPSVSYTMVGYNDEAGDKDDTALALNLLKFDVIF